VFIVRDATEADLSAILDIYNDAIANSTAVFSDQLQTLDMRRQWFRDKHLAGWPVVVAAEQDEVVGFGTYGPFRAWPGYRYTVEHSIYVAPAARRRGVGTALLHALIALARQGRFHAIVAGIDSENEPSLRLHQQLGFADAGHLREVGQKFGRWLDLVFLQLIIDAAAPGVPPDRSHD